MQDESHWIDRAQSAEARLITLKEAYEPALERIKEFKKNFGVREASDGRLLVDYDRFADAIGPDGALELRAIIDQKFSIAGAPGTKPRIRVPATSGAA